VYIQFCNGWTDKALEQKVVIVESSQSEDDKEIGPKAVISEDSSSRGNFIVL